MRRRIRPTSCSGDVGNLRFCALQNPLGASPAERKKGFIEPEWQLTLHQLCGPDGTCPPRQERWAQRYADTPRDATVTTPADYVVSFWN